MLLCISVLQQKLNNVAAPSSMHKLFYNVKSASCPSLFVFWTKNLEDIHDFCLFDEDLSFGRKFVFWKKICLFEENLPFWQKFLWVTIPKNYDIRLWAQISSREYLPAYLNLCSLIGTHSIFFYSGGRALICMTNLSH